MKLFNIWPNITYYNLFSVLIVREMYVENDSEIFES